MTYVGQLPSTELLGTLINFFPIRFAELYSDWSMSYFREFCVFWEFHKVKLFILPFFNVGLFRKTMSPAKILLQFSGIPHQIRMY